MAEVDAEILHELVMNHRIGRAAGAVQEGLQTLATHVVDTGQTEHIELLKRKGGLNGPQGLHLATHADGKQPADTAAGQLLKHPQVGGQGGLVHPGRQHLGGGAGQHGHGCEAIVGTLLHAQHRIHQAALQGPHTEATHDAGPLGALNRGGEPGAEHALLHTEVELVLVGKVARAAMGLVLHRLEALLEEGAGVAHVGHPTAVAQAALAAEILGRIGAAGGKGPRPLMGQGRGLGRGRGGGQRGGPADLHKAQPIGPRAGVAAHRWVRVCSYWPSPAPCLPAGIPNHPPQPRAEAATRVGAGGPPIRTHGGGCDGPGCRGRRGEIWSQGDSC